MIKQRKQNGFSLLELLLATAVLAALLVGGFAILQDYTEREIGKTIATQMKKINAVMRAELSDPAKFDAYFVEAANSALQVSLTNTVPCAPRSPNLTQTCKVGGIDIPPATGFFTGSALVNAKNNNLSLILIPRDNANQNLRSFEIIVAVNTPQNITLVAPTAMAMGGNGGRVQDKTKVAAISGYNARANIVLQSSFNSWRFDTTASPLNATLRNTAWFIGIPPTMPNTQGISIHYDFMTRGDALGDTMYRTAQPAATANLNTMYTDLSLGGNNLVGADNVRVQGKMTLNGELHSSSAMAAIAGMTVNGSVTALKDPSVADPALTGPLWIEATEIRTTKNTDITINNAAAPAPTTVSNLNVANRLDATTGTTNSLTSNELNTGGSTIVNNTLSGATTINTQTLQTNLNARVNATDFAYVERLNANNTGLNLQNQDLFVGGTKGIQTLSTRDLRTNGDLWINNNVQLGIFGDCGQGCE